jgi:ABC-2 type transport system permease protein
MLFGVLYFVFTRFVRFGTALPDYAVNLLLGIVLWTYFADSTTRAMASIVERGDLIRKVYFPRQIIVVATSLSSLITLAFNLVVVAAFIVFSGAGFRPTAPLFIVLVIELYVLALGCSFLLSAVYVQLRDSKQVYDIALQLLFYASPIIYPLSLIPARWQQLLSINPIAQIIQDSRKVLIDPSISSPVDIIHSPLVALPYTIPVLVLLIGYLYFDYQAARFAEEI